MARNAPGTTGWDAPRARSQSPSWLAQIYDATAWYWDSFVHGISYGRAYRALFERLRREEWSERTFSRVLDCGIGAGVFSEGFIRALGAPARVYGVDLSRRLLKKAAARLGRHGVRPHLLRADARALPIADSQMDAVLCGLVLDHLGEASAALEELARVARPGAPVVIVTTRPFAPDLPVRAVFRYRRLRPEAIERAMAKIGLREVRRHLLTGLARPFGIAFTARARTGHAVEDEG
jgi:ubiquinone/menaquinone biosynthesis C-methylase UbiE